MVDLVAAVTSEVKPPTPVVETVPPKITSPAVDLAFTLAAVIVLTAVISPAAVRLISPAATVFCNLIALAVALVVVIDKLPVVMFTILFMETVPDPSFIIRFFPPAVTIPMDKLPEVLLMAILSLRFKALLKLMLPEPVVTSPEVKKLFAARETFPAVVVMSPAPAMVIDPDETFRFTSPVPLDLTKPLTFKVSVPPWFIKMDTNWFAAPDAALKSIPPAPIVIASFLEA